MCRKMIPLVCLFLINTCWAISLRTLVALPIPKGDAVFRMLNTVNTDTDKNMLSMSAAVGLHKDHTVFIGTPYQIYPKGSGRGGDVSVLYRYMMVQDDETNGTFRVGALFGGFFPTTSTSDGGVREGLVATYYRDRSEWDADLIVKQGFKETLNEVQYDVSWQYRIAPTQYPKWGLSSFWNTVLEYNGRQKEGSDMSHQVTAGLQWSSPPFVVEGGVFKALNGEKHLSALMSIRYRM